MKRSIFLVSIILIFYPLRGYSMEITDKLSISGTATGVYQWLSKEMGDVDEKARGSAVLDFNISFKAIQNGELLLRASFAMGDGLKEVSPFLLSPNADDLYHDLKDINGTERDNLLELWYSHKFEIKKDTCLKLTGGIIDSTSFIDSNSYAADELGQFMNEALVHNPIANLPSYDPGLAIEFELGNFHIRGVGMSSKNDFDKYYKYFALQFGYKAETLLGEGNYRVYGFATDRRFLNWEGDAYRGLKGIGASLDQQLIKDILGGFLRAGWQDDSAQVAYKWMVSMGFNISGSIWGRKEDEIGLGYGYLKSPSRSDVSCSHVFEGYIKFKLFSYKALNSDFTIDYQYMKDRVSGDGDRGGHIAGVRWNINF